MGRIQKVRNEKFYVPIFFTDIDEISSRTIKFNHNI